MTHNYIENIRVEKLKTAHRKIYTDITIDATPEEVWEVLTDTKSYQNWASFLVDIQGEILDGNKITVIFQMNPQDKKRTTIDHIISVREGREFYWAEKGLGGIRDNHHFIVEPIENGKTLFIQSDEIMKGITWIMGGYLSKTYAKGYQGFNRNLKKEVERRYR